MVNFSKINIKKEQWASVREILQLHIFQDKWEHRESPNTTNEQEDAKKDDWIL